VSVAPWEIVVTVVKPDDEATMAAALAIYDALRNDGIDVILDDRKERPGVKFNDAELVGIPFRITVGPRSLAQGEVEVSERRTGDTSVVAVEEAAGAVARRVLAAR
jgi:prolyl-tRNA synthetase